MNERTNKRTNERTYEQTYELVRSHLSTYGQTPYIHWSDPAYALVRPTYPLVRPRLSTVYPLPIVDSVYIHCLDQTNPTYPIHTMSYIQLSQKNSLDSVVYCFQLFVGRHIAAINNSNAFN